MFNFEQVEQMKIPKFTHVEVFDIKAGRSNQKIGMMNFSTIMSKFR